MAAVLLAFIWDRAAGDFVAGSVIFGRFFVSNVARSFIGPDGEGLRYRFVLDGCVGWCVYHGTVRFGEWGVLVSFFVNVSSFCAAGDGGDVHDVECRGDAFNDPCGGILGATSASVLCVDSCDIKRAFGGGLPDDSVVCVIDFVALRNAVAIF